MSTQKSEKHEQARNNPPDELKPIFHHFVADYKFAATKHHSAPYVSYVVLADMARAGWQLVEPLDTLTRRQPG